MHALLPLLHIESHGFEGRIKHARVGGKTAGLGLGQRPVDMGGKACRHCQKKSNGSRFGHVSLTRSTAESRSSNGTESNTVTLSCGKSDKIYILAGTNNAC